MTRFVDLKDEINCGNRFFESAVEKSISEGKETPNEGIISTSTNSGDLSIPRSSAGASI